MQPPTGWLITFLLCSQKCLLLKKGYAKEIAFLFIPVNTQRPQRHIQKNIYTEKFLYAREAINSAHAQSSVITFPIVYFTGVLNISQVTP